MEEETTMPRNKGGLVTIDWQRNLLEQGKVMDK